MLKNEEIIEKLDKDHSRLMKVEYELNFFSIEILALLAVVVTVIYFLNLSIVLSILLVGIIFSLFFYLIIFKRIKAVWLRYGEIKNSIKKTKNNISK
jgi:ABC-type multidrug transport system fused ATPase/permease subunit